ncbi:HAD family hydrolase [Streptomyces sp. NPDC088745]|uniref:HAD family hydrolase n=1 Tax=Streptomyces sp. NPDC088745 TaxID=3365884 RepID=UPI00381337AE
MTARTYDASPPSRQDPVDLVIFDCDGVLVDSERLCVQVDARITAELGCPFTEAEIVETFVGCSYEVYTAAVEQRLGRRLAPDWLDAYEHLYLEAFEAGLTAVDGVADALARLGPTPFCVASNGRHQDIRRSLSLTSLDPHFDDSRIFSASDVALGKPAPDLFLHAARSLGVPPERCAVVEDSPYGVRAARAAGMRSFGYHGGLTKPERLAGPGTVLFDDMRALPALLGLRRAPADVPRPGRLTLAESAFEPRR